MKNIFISMFMLFVLCSISYSMTNVTSRVDGYNHDGFYLSVSGGISMPILYLNETEIEYGNRVSSNVAHLGDGLTSDIKAGYSIGRNVILHGTFIYNWGLYSNISDEGPTNSPEGVFTTENMFGGGITYYSQKKNTFISLSVGSTGINIKRTWMSSVREPKIGESTRGFGGQIKAGKEWVEKVVNYGLGCGINYLSAWGTGFYEGRMSSFSLFLSGNISLK